MASGPHHHQHQHHHQQQQQQQQQQQHQQHVMQHQQSNQMQFTPSHPAGLGTTNYDQHQHLHQQNTMSPSSTAMSINHTQGGIVSMNNHQHHQQQQAQLMGTFVASTMITSGNQSASHIQQQKSQILPLLLSPRPSSLTPTSNDQLEQTGDDHDQIIDQVISLENEYSDTSGMLGSVESGTGGGVMMNNQHQQHHQQQQHQHQHLQHNLGDMNLSASISIPDSNQFSSSSEDLLNLLLEFDREPTNLIGSIQHIDQDEKVGIENIRQQLMSCEMQSEHTNTNSMSPIVSNQMTCQPQQPRVTPQEQQHSQSRNQQQLTQIISQSAPIISHHQLSSTGTSQQQQLSADQSILHGSYSNASMSTVPVSSSGQPYAPQQQQHVTRISQSNPMSIVNSSPSPSWQQPQLSPYSPQPPHNTSRTPSQRQGQHQQHHQIHHPQQQQQQPSHGMQQHQSSTSPQMQQLHHTLQQRSPSQSLSPPATTEPSPVVKKNPLLNAQLVNTRAPSITPTRFMNNQANLLNQNPILNAKLSQNPFVPNNSGNIVGSPVNPSLNSQSRVIQQATQQTNFSYDISQQQQNAQQHTSQQGHVNIFGPSCDQQQQQQQTGNRLYRTNTAGSGAASSGLGNTSPGGNLSQQVKQEIRRKVQPKKQHQTTSLLKQLLSDDNK